MKPLTLYSLLAFAVLSRLFTFFIFQFELQGYEWNVIAENLMAGRGYLFQWEWQGAPVIAFGFPGMPWVLAQLYQLPISQTTAFVLYQCTLTLICSWLIIHLCRSWFSNPIVPFIGVFIFCFEPALVLYCTIKIHDTSLILCLLLLAFFFIDRDMKHPNSTWKTLLPLALCLGFGAYVRSTLLLVFPAVLVVYAARKESHRKIIPWLLAFLMSVSLLSPWIIRNQIKLGQPLIHSADTFNFWRGNNEYASGSALSPDGKTILQRSENYSKVLWMQELERREFFRQQTHQWISDHPFQFFKGVFKKFYYFWGFAPQSGHLYPPLWIQLYKWIYALEALLLGLGLWRSIKTKPFKNQPMIQIVFCFALFISFIQSLFYVEGRHRLILYPIFIPWMAMGVTFCTQTLICWIGSKTSALRPGAGPLS